MDMNNVGGSPGGMRAFLLGIIMICVGGYLLMNQVSVHGGFWNFGFLGGYGRHPGWVRSRGLYARAPSIPIQIVSNCIRP